MPQFSSGVGSPAHVYCPNTSALVELSNKQRSNLSPESILCAQKNIFIVAKMNSTAKISPKDPGKWNPELRLDSKEEKPEEPKKEK